MMKYVLGLNLLLLCCHTANCQKQEACNGTQLVRIDAQAKNSTCGFVTGRVQICEANEWRNLCDSDWTLQDAHVVCRSLNYSTIGAENNQNNQVTSGSNNGVNCSGSEEDLSDCTKYMVNSASGASMCDKVILVLCFITDEKAVLRCSTSASETTLGPSDSTTPTPAENSSSSNIGIHQSTESTVAATTGGPFIMGTDANFFTSPTLYYFIGALSAVILVMLLLVTLIILWICQKRKKSNLSTEIEQEDKERDEPLALQQSLPIYETIQSNDSSTEPQQHLPVYEYILTNDSSTEPQQLLPVYEYILTNDFNTDAHTERSSNSRHLTFHLNDECSVNPAYGISPKLKDCSDCSANPAYGVSSHHNQGQ